MSKFQLSQHKSCKLGLAMSQSLIETRINILIHKKCTSIHMFMKIGLKTQVTATYDP